MPIYRIKEQGITGLADVKVGKDKITVKYVEDGSVYNILPEDVFDSAHPIDGKYYVSLSADGAKIRGVYPPKGGYFCKFDRFAAKKDEPPCFREVAFNPKWNTPAHLEYTYVFKIVEGKFKEWEIIKSVWYCFKQYQQTTNIAISGRGSKTTEEILQTLGVDLAEDITFDYSDNVLPELEKVIQSKDVKLFISIKDGGWVGEIATAPEE